MKNAKIHDLKEWKIQKYEVIFEAAQSRFWRFSLKKGHFWAKLAPRGLKDDLIYLNFPFFEVMNLCIHTSNTTSFGLKQKISQNEDEKFWATER